MVEKWVERMKKEVDKLDYESVLKGFPIYCVKSNLGGMLHEDFMFRTDYADYVHNSTDFVRDCINNYQGKKLYVCGIIDFHY